MMMFDSESCIRALCLVDGDDPERPGLLRLADVNAAGRLIAPAPGKGWADRQRFYRQDGPGELGKLGFWEFQGTRNLKNPDRWFIKSRFLPARPVRIDDHFWSLSTGGIINSLKPSFCTGFCLSPMSQDKLKRCPTSLPVPISILR